MDQYKKEDLPLNGNRNDVNGETTTATEWQKEEGGWPGGLVLLEEPVTRLGGRDVHVHVAFGNK